MNECEVSCTGEARADIARFKIVASVRVTFTIFPNLSIVNSPLFSLHSGAKSSDSTP